MIKNKINNNDLFNIYKNEQKILLNLKKISIT